MSVWMCVGLSVRVYPVYLSFCSVCSLDMSVIVVMSCYVGLCLSPARVHVPIDKIELFVYNMFVTCSL